MSLITITHVIKSDVNVSLSALPGKIQRVLNTHVSNSITVTYGGSTVLIPPGKFIDFWYDGAWFNSLDERYPIGAIYQSVVSASPATLFGGTWSAFAAGRVLVGLDSSDTSFDTVEETGGAKTHTLSESEMPYHNHKSGEVLLPGGTVKSWWAKEYFTSYEMGDDMSTYAGGSGGVTQAHNNLQPYIVVYMWKRTA